MNLPPESSALEIYLLGLVDFDEIQQLQRRLVYDLGERERSGGALILCEHPPTISVGRSGSRAHILSDDQDLRGRGIAVRWVNRGGGCVLHLPGQLVGYFAFPLASSRFDLKEYLDGLHRVLIAVLGEFDLEGSTQPDCSGVFLGPTRVASVGVAVNRWIAYHGFSLNVSTFLEPFETIAEPITAGGRAIVRQTSMESRRQRPAPMAKVREAVIRQVEAVFGLERHHLYTHHPLIRRKVASHVYASSPG
jgi:lipoyl(octanoyl) transferase